MAVVRFRPELYRWRRFSQPSSQRKTQSDADSVEHWIKRVEQASEFAVSEAFSLKKPSYSQKLQNPVLNLETEEQLIDHDEAYVEAHELLSEWMNSRLKLELAGYQENDADSSVADFIPSQEPTVGFQKFQKFDDFYGYLEQEVESTKVQDFLHHLLQSETVNSDIIENLKTGGFSKKRKARDPRISMELRHKQVKENRLRQQKQLELLKQEHLLKKFASSEAQKQLQEEQKKKALKAKKEEEEMQKQMVILRKELVDKRRLMEEARKMERKRHNFKKSLIETDQLPDVVNCMDSWNEEQRKEKQAKMQKLLHKIIIADQKFLRKYFCAWYKLVEDLRIKMGKARALADWKCQLRIFRAWRDYSWTCRLEIQKMENQLQDQNRKKQLAVEFNQKCILRHYFAEWQCWSQLQVKKRVLEMKKEEMKCKMAKFLEVLSQRQFTTDFSRPNENIHLIKATQHKPSSDTEVTEVPYVQNDPKIAKLETENSNFLETSKKCNLHSPRKPKWAWQVTMKHAALNAQDHAIFRNQTNNTLQHPSPTSQKTSLAVSGPTEHHHAFQQQLIEEQRRQLQEQQELIQKLQETQRLHIAWKETKRATAGTMPLDSHASKTKGEKLRENQSNFKDTKFIRSENQHAAAQKKNHLKVLITPHPLLKAMEERAIQRAERKRALEEAKKRREDEKLAEMQAKEEERQKQEATERQAQIEKRQEEKKLQKMKELEKQRRLEREQQLLSKAEDHYIKVLLKKQGLKPWKRLIEQARKNMVNAQRHHQAKLQRKCLLAWLHHVQDTYSKKIAQAEELYSYQLRRRSFKKWIKYKDYVLILEENASEIYEINLKKKIFRAWFDEVNEEKSVLWEKQKIADQYSNRRMMQLAFETWRQFPARMKEEREKEERIGKLRKRVAEILPDFQT